MFYFVILRFPGFGRTAADWLVANSSVVGVGVETVSLEMGLVQDVHVHR